MMLVPNICAKFVTEKLAFEESLKEFKVIPIILE
jgi:hypothetical protein